MMHGASGRAHDAWTVIVAHAVLLLRGAEALMHYPVLVLVQAQPILLGQQDRIIEPDQNYCMRRKNKGNRAPK